MKKKVKIPIKTILLISLVILALGVFTFEMITNHSFFNVISTSIQSIGKATKHINPDTIDRGISFLERISTMMIGIVPTYFLIKDHNKKKRNKKEE